MAYLNIYKDKLHHNFKYLDQLFSSKNIDWAVVSKILCGNKELLELLIDLGISEICDARISNLEKIKKNTPRGKHSLHQTTGKAKYFKGRKVCKCEFQYRIRHH